jgi:hypothetical protein
MMKWVVLNSLGKICRAPFKTEEEASASAARASHGVTVKIVSEEEATRLMDEHFIEIAGSRLRPLLDSAQPV